MMSSYLYSCDVLGEVTIPKAGVSYTDRATVLAVQKALKAIEIDPGPLDGVFGPKTAAAVRILQNTLGMEPSGVIDYGVLIALKISAPTGSAPTAPAPARTGVPGYAQVIPTPIVPPVPLRVEPTVWQRPLWRGSPVKVWQAALGGAVGVTAAGIMIMRLR